MIKINEGGAVILADKNAFDKVSLDLDVFYNPLMEINRTISVLFINSVTKQFGQLNVALPLAASGVRGIRFLRECKINSIKFNDRSSGAIDLLKKNLELNDINFISQNEFEKGYLETQEKKTYRSGKVIVSEMDANKFLHSTFYSDYVDIDPFGSPVEFLDSSIARLNKSGFLAVTATDTAALTGSSNKACRRRYGVFSFNAENKHEFSLRVLAAKVINQAANHDRLLEPVFAHATDHYARIYFKSSPGKKKVDEFLNQIKPISVCEKCRNHVVDQFAKCSVCDSNMVHLGPIFIGKLSDSNLIDSMKAELDLLNGKYELNYVKKIDDVLKSASDYSSIDLPFGYSITLVIRNLVQKFGKGPKEMPKLDFVLAQIKEKGYNAICVDKKYLLIKTNMPFAEFMSLFQ